jgi:hypothetical protein
MSFRLERWGLFPRPNLEARVFIHATFRSEQPANGVAAATRARVDAPSFFRYAFRTCRLCASRIRRAGEKPRGYSSKPNASVWMPHKNRHLRLRESRAMGKSVQSPDNPFMSFVDYSHSFSHTEKRAPPLSGKSSALA